MGLMYVLMHPDIAYDKKIMNRLVPPSRSLFNVKVVGIHDYRNKEIQLLQKFISDCLGV